MRETKEHWQKILADGFASAETLLAYLNLPSELGCQQAEQLFKTRVPRQFAARMQPGNRFDPLLLQVLAHAEEQHNMPGYFFDPLQETTANPIPGLIHKYKSRVLLTLTGVCAINCRFCFRRHFPYETNNPGQIGWQKACEYIAENSQIDEVILSGGDPLLASNRTLKQLMGYLKPITHVRTIRIHTRIPIVLTERIHSELLDIFDTQRFHIVVVLHSNHPQELDDTVAKACSTMKQSGWLLLNQSVLLKGINDQANILATLSRRLFECGVLPYYLHLPDKVSGTHHFDLPIQRALSIFHGLQSQLPGYLVPRLVREDPKEPYKTLLTSIDPV